MRKFLIKKMSIFLTEECDRNCFFCDIAKIPNQKPLNKELLEKYLPYIDQSDSFYHYTITGGEPGLVDVDSWDYLFDTLQCHPIRINTNGKFFENGYWDKYKDKIWQIGLHVDINKDIPFQIEDDSVWYYVPVHRKNYLDFLKFIKKYPKLNFSVIPYIHKDLSLDFDEYSLGEKECLKVLHDIKDIKNVADCTKEMLDLINRKSQNIQTFRDSCKYNFVQPLLDFANGRIGRCVFSYTQNKYLPMNKENLDKLFVGQLDFGEKDTACDVCYECFRYYEYYFNNQIVKGCNVFQQY